MTTYEQDPDVVWWGLQLFEGAPFADTAYCGYGQQNHADSFDQQYSKEDLCDTGCINMENNECLLHAIQENPTQFSVAEAAGSSCEGVVPSSQVSFYPQDWLDQPMGNYSFGHENGNEMEDNLGPSSSCGSPGRQLYCGNEWSYSLELSDEYALDGEVGKRLNQMVSIPHVPRINGEIPSIDEATLDHQRLLNRLQLYQFVECKVQGDGNCQFRALSDQVYRTPEHHKFVRQQVVNQLKLHAEIYEGYVPMTYCDYLKNMAKVGEWGDHVTLQAAADLYGIKIFVITSFKDTCYIEILPNVPRSNRVIFLSFWAEVHYNSIYLEEDVPTYETMKTKQHSTFQVGQFESRDNEN